MCDGSPRAPQGTRRSWGRSWALWDPFLLPSSLSDPSDFLGSGCLEGVARWESVVNSWCHPSYDGWLRSKQSHGIASCKPSHWGGCPATDSEAPPARCAVDLWLPPGSSFYVLPCCSIFNFSLMRANRWFLFKIEINVLILKHYLKKTIFLSHLLVQFASY